MTAELLTPAQVDALLALDSIAGPWWAPKGLTLSNRLSVEDKTIATATARTLESHSLAAILGGVAYITDRGKTTAARIRQALG